jgi:glycosyltransferase involved in cell wall biosynthesis
MPVLIVCDGFRIGGIERLTLDQAYELSCQEISCQIIILSEKLPPHLDSFAKNEKKLINKYKIKISYFGGSRVSQLLKLYRILKNETSTSIISHSLRGSVLLWIIRIRLRKKLKIITTIHQLPTLSAPIQRTKRMFYSQFCDELYIFSLIAYNDWKYRMHKNLFLKLISTHRKLSVCRNGVFLPRLNIINDEVSKSLGSPTRIIYIGRLTKWKGLEKFLEIAQLEEFKKLKILVITSTKPDISLIQNSKSLGKRVEFIVGKSISEIKFSEGDVHLYPVSLGEKGKFVEGVSINVLEMACLGIPSLISMGGSKTWPELLDLGLIYEVDWNSTEGLLKLLNSENLNPSKVNIKKARTLIDIKNNLNLLLK